MSVLIVGSVALDTIKTPFGKVKDILGGSAIYSSVSAKVFSPVNLVAVVGQDFPKKHIDFLKDSGIDIKGLQVKKGKTFRWEGEYGKNLSDPKTIATHLNVFAEFDPVIPKSYQKIKHVFLANIDPKIQEKVLSQISKPKLVACDTMNYWIENKCSDLLKILKRVDVFLLNELEAKLLTNKSNLIKAGKELINLGPSLIVIKKGEHGVLLFSKGNIFSAPAFLLEMVFDPTGAGDTFAGGFIGYLAKKNKYTQKTLREAIVYANIMATFAVEDFSLRRLASIKITDVNKRIKEFKKLTTF